jgi:hypothetical protein
MAGAPRRARGGGQYGRSAQILEVSELLPKDDIESNGRQLSLTIARIGVLLTFALYAALRIY